MARPTFRLSVGIQLAALFIVSSVEAAVFLTQPIDGTEYVTQPCAGVCSTTIATAANYTAGGAVSRLVVVATRDGVTFEDAICTAPDPIEPTSSIPSCDTPPASYISDIRLGEGVWILRAKAIRNGFAEFSDPITVGIRSPIPPIGQLQLQSFDPVSADGIQIQPSGGLDLTDLSAREITIRGVNIDQLAQYQDALQNPFLEVYLAPIPVNEPTLRFDSGLLPERRYCMTKLTIVDGSIAPGQVKVRLPNSLPLETAARCGDESGPSAPSFNYQWRLVIRDTLTQLGRNRVHEWWAMPSPRVGVAWEDQPPLRFTQPEYPFSFGFAFDNESDSATLNEFTSVYDNNAYLCVGLFGVCATRIPDPLYFSTWLPLYKLMIDGSNGSCVGLASTSRLLANGNLSLDDYELSNNPVYPVQVTSPDNIDFDFPMRNDYMAKFRKGNVCSPFCGPMKSDNLWSKIRQNHGKQLSLESISQVLLTLGSTVVDPTDVGAVRGVPQVTLDRIRDNPDRYVVCMVSFGNGHCVTPYQVQGNEIFVYDNNRPRNRTYDDNGVESPAAQPVITVSDGSYSYNGGLGDLDSGRGLFAYPIEMFEGRVRLIGLNGLGALVNGDIVEFFFALVAGNADALYVNSAGDTVGYDENGQLVDDYLGAVAVPSFGPYLEPTRQLPMVLPTNRPAPMIKVHSRGGRYLVNVGQEGQLLQVETDHAQVGDVDRVELSYSDISEVDGFRFSPQRHARAAQIRVGMRVSESASAVFNWQALSVPPVGAAEFGADRESKQATYVNDTTSPSGYIMTVDYADGPSEVAGRMGYGPIVTPPNAQQFFGYGDWPEVATLTVESDFDRDGVIDQVEQVPGFPLPSGLMLETSADLALTEFGATESEGELIYQYSLRNSGEDAAMNVQVLQFLSDQESLVGLDSAEASCDVTVTPARCAIASLNAGQSIELALTISPNSSGKATPRILVFSEAIDADQTNNSLSPELALDSIFSESFE